MVAESRGGPGMIDGAPERRRRRRRRRAREDRRRAGHPSRSPRRPGRSTRAPLTLRSWFAEAVTVFGSASSDPAVRLEPSAEKLKPARGSSWARWSSTPPTSTPTARTPGWRATSARARRRTRRATRREASSSGGASRPRRARARLLRGAAAGRAREVARGREGRRLWRLPHASFLVFRAGRRRRDGASGRGGARRTARARARRGRALLSGRRGDYARARAWARVVGGENPHGPRAPPWSPS